MPGESDLFNEFAKTLDPVVAGLAREVFGAMANADTLGSLLKVEDDLHEAVEAARRQWESRGTKAVQMSLGMEHARPVAVQQAFPVDTLTDASFFDRAEQEVVDVLRAYAKQAAAQEEQNTLALSRRLFAEDAEQGFAFVDLCRRKFDVVLMNPPFGDAASPSKKYLEDTYGDTKGDVYKAFVECFQDRLVPGGYLGAITSRTGFFLGQSADWRERVLLRLYRPLALADLGAGVLDAMVETAAYVLRSLTEDERRALTVGLAERLGEVGADKSGRFTRVGYQKAFGRKRHQAEQELAWLEADGFVVRIPGEVSLTTGKTGPDRFKVAGKTVRDAGRAGAAPPVNLTCLRLLAGRTNDAKQEAMNVVLADPTDKRRFAVNPEDFKLVPGQPFSYWVSDKIRRLFDELPAFEGDGRTAKQGLATADDFRFVRNWWEVPPGEVCRPHVHPKTFSGPYCVLKYQWFPFAKGGSCATYYADVNLVANWQQVDGPLR